MAEYFIMFLRYHPSKGANVSHNYDSDYLWRLLNLVGKCHRDDDAVMLLQEQCLIVPFDWTTKAPDLWVLEGEEDDRYHEWPGRNLLLLLLYRVKEISSRLEQGDHASVPDLLRKMGELYPIKRGDELLSPANSARIWEKYVRHVAPSYHGHGWYQSRGRPDA